MIFFKTRLLLLLYGSRSLFLLQEEKGEPL